MVVPPYFDVPPKAYGGVEAVVADLVDALADRGHEVTLLGAGEPGTKAARFIPLWDEIQAARLGDPFPEVVHAIKVRRALERVSALHGLDLVHDHTFAGPLNLPTYRELDLPMVVTVHGPVDGDPYMYYSELGEDAALVAISDRQRELAPDLNWAGRVHNALRTEDWPFQPVKEDYALFLGRYTPDKAPHLALAAAHAVGLPLVLAGKCAEPPEQRYFDAEVAPLLTNQDHVFGMADTAAKRKLLAGARCLLFPVQWEEPFGMVMIEAMVCGTPVVALRGGAVGEVIVDGVTGRICDDPAEMPYAIKEVQTYDPQACRDHVLENFGAETLGRGYEEVYRRVLLAQRPRRSGRVTTHSWSGTPILTPPVRAAGTGPGRAPAANSRVAGPAIGRGPNRTPGAAAGRAAGPAPSRVPAPIPTPTSRPLGTSCDSGMPLAQLGSTPAGAVPPGRILDPAAAVVPSDAGTEPIPGGACTLAPEMSTQPGLDSADLAYPAPKTIHHPTGPVGSSTTETASTGRANDVVASDVPGRGCG
ncbi:glycosyltransferase [Nocardia uniformis]|uniref:Glycosyltransferase n=1 Tax=Nocardia uniformis TaxID=53432 RepID=A0A849C654_9NOCA|nr:glycosyltransferase [Nocardia uniformis]